MILIWATDKNKWKGNVLIQITVKSKSEDLCFVNSSFTKAFLTKFFVYLLVHSVIHSYIHTNIRTFIHSLPEFNLPFIGAFT